MDKGPWITIVGLGEDGPDGLSPASREALAKAEVIMGPKRHLGLLPDVSAEQIEWPVPFADGIELLRAQDGRQVVVLASGDPFWFGAGSVIARHFAPGTFRSLPASSVFSLAAAAMPLETTACLGLHAGPLSRLRPHLAKGARLIVLLRDGAAVHDLARYLADLGFGDSNLTVLERLGGAHQKIRAYEAQAEYAHPVCAAVTVQGTGKVIHRASGRPDDLFETDGVMTKRAVRALTLSTLAPSPGELLWDIGAGSGSIALEWMLSHPACRAIAIEPRADRAKLIARNAQALGVDQLEIVEASAPDCLEGLPIPDVVFVGGGLSRAMIDSLQNLAPVGTRLVANAVTLESEALLGELHAKHGGELMRIDIAQVTPMGGKRGWRAAYPVAQWSVVL